MVGRVLVPLIIVGALGAVGFIFGLKAPSTYLVGVVIPYAAMATFFAGFIYKVYGWAKTPVPFSIATTCGQQQSLPWIEHDKLEAPATKGQVIMRMALEILAFRSLFRGTQASVTEGPTIKYSSSKWLWVAGLAFHWSFFITFVRHFRLFAANPPALISMIEAGDGFFQVTLPTLYISGFVLLGALTFLVVRRLFYPQVTYISLPADYFPLFLILAVATTGVMMRYVPAMGVRPDIAHVKEFIQGLFSFSPHIPEGLSPMFYAHLLLVSVLIAYFPFSKLMHMGGVFFSPTRNMTNDTRRVRHINPWNPDVHFHTYEEYEEDFWKAMKSVDLPLDKNYEGHEVKE